MAYDGMYGDLSTRATANETLNLALQVQTEINATAIEVDTDASEVAANLATSTDILNQIIEIASGPIPTVGLTPQLYGAMGDGVTDDTVAFQDALTAAEGGLLNVPAGTYLCGELIVKTKTKILGFGAGSTIIKAKASLPSNKPLLINEQFGSLNVYADENIEITGVGFDGSNLTTRSVELVSLIKVRNPRISKCKFYNVQFMGFALGGCKEFSITENEFTNCGNPAVVAEGGAALWIGNYFGDGTVSTDGTIINNFFHNNNWSALYLNGNRNTVSSNQFRSNRESTIFGTGSFNMINDNNITSAIRKNISASGIEIGGAYWTITGNLINQTGSDSISCTDAQVVTISGNTLTDPAREPAYFPTASGITIITTQANPNNPRYFNIVGNNFYVSDSAAYAGVHVGNSGDAPISLFVTQNNLQSNTWTSGKAVKVDAGKLSISTVIQGNPGDFDQSLAGGYRSGRFYAGENLTPATAGTAALVANTLYSTVFTVRQPQLWTKIGFNVTVAGAGGTMARVGVYEIVNGIPTNLVFDAGAIAVSTTGLKEITISQLLLPGTYGMAIVSSGTPTISADVNSKAAIGCIGSVAIGTGDQVVTRAFTYGALPSPFGSVTFTTGLTPLITLRYGV